MRRVGCCLLLLWLAGCANYTWTARLDGQPQRTVAFTTIENRLFPHRPGYEYELTQRLKEEIAVDRRLVLEEGNTDIRMKIALTRFDEPNLVEDLDTGLPAEINLIATADVEASGETVPGGRVRRRVTVSTSYTPGLGDSRREGMDRLWRDLAREIIDVASDVEWAR